MTEDNEIKNTLRATYNLPISVTVKKNKQKKVPHFTAECLEFGLSACGPTENQAVSLLREQVGLYLDSCQVTGVIEETLKTAGFKDLIMYYPCQITRNSLRVLDKNGKFIPEWNNMDGSSCSFMKRKKIER